jgi:hypothetical protein
MDEQATPHATDDALPSPFRRFPWVQLVFCVACLTMTAWTWMRFSYAWETTPTALCGPTPPHVGSEWVERYVDIHGDTTVTTVSIANGGGASYFATVYEVDPRLPDLATSGTSERSIVLHPLDADLKDAGSRKRWRGRVIMEHGSARIDTSASRFHPASIAGLVVGTMGVFIFGLYLRRWVKERRAGA